MAYREAKFLEFAPAGYEGPIGATFGACCGVIKNHLVLATTRDVFAAVADSILDGKRDLPIVGQKELLKLAGEGSGVLVLDQVL